MWGGYVLIPEEIVVQTKNMAPDRRLLAILNKSYHHYCAMLPKADIHYFLISKSVLKKLGARIGDRIVVELKKPELKYGVPISEEFQAVLDSDEEGSSYFHHLTPGAQRSLILAIGKYKNPQLRLDCSILIMRHLILRNGNLDFKILGQKSFKDSVL